MMTIISPIMMPKTQPGTACFRFLALTLRPNRLTAATSSMPARLIELALGFPLTFKVSIAKGESGSEAWRTGVSVV